MKFTCDQCHAQYMIADEKIGPRGVKVKCKKCAHIIIVKPPAEAAPSEAPQERRDTAAGGGFGDSPFNEPTQAMSQEQLQALAAAASTPRDDAAAAPAAAWPPPADASSSFSAPPASDPFAGFAPPAGGEASTSSMASPFGGGFGGTDPAASAPSFTGGGFGEADPGASAPSFAGGGFPGGDVGGPPSGEGEVNFDSAFAAKPAAAPSRPRGEKEWYVAIDESQVGPVDLGDIEERWDARELNEDSLAWKAGMENWLPIAEVAELAYLVTERPQQKTELVPGLAAGSPAVASAAAAAAGLGPVTFGGQAGGAGDVSWTPSAASALSSLVQDELVTTPPTAPAPVTAGPGPAELGMPTFGASDLFGAGASGGGALGPAPAALPPVMPGDPFSGASGSWATPKPGSSGGLKPIHLAVAGMSLMGVALIAVVVVLLLRQPPAVAVTPGNATAAMGQVNTPPATPTSPTPPATPTTATDAPDGTTPTPREATEPAKAKDGGRKTTPRDKTPGKEKPTKASRDIFDDLPSAKGGPPPKPALDMADLKGGVKNGMGSVMGCIKDARSKGELAPGTHTLTLSWVITPAGAVTDPKLTGPAGVLGTSLPGCFARGMRAWKFPPSKAGAPVRNFPFGPFTIK